MHNPCHAVILGDTHFPFHSKEGVDRAIDLIHDLKPEMVLQIGDLYDNFSSSKYSKTPNLVTPEDEARTGRQCAEIMWAEIKKASPGSKRVQLTGNHDERTVKKILDVANSHEHIAREYFIRQMTFPGVQLISDEKEEFIHEGVTYIHGYRKFGEHAVFNQMSTVCGHLHRGELKMFKNVHGAYFELNVGWLGDRESPVFSYKSQKKLDVTTLGVGIIDHLGPRFVSFEP